MIVVHVMVMVMVAVILIHALFVMFDCHCGWSGALLVYALLLLVSLHSDHLFHLMHEWLMMVGHDEYLVTIAGHDHDQMMHAMIWPVSVE